MQGNPTKTVEIVKGGDPMAREAWRRRRRQRGRMKCAVHVVEQLEVNPHEPRPAA